MRVLSVQHYPAFGGPYNEILRLYEPLAAAGAEIVVAMPREEGTAAGRLSEAGIDARRIDLDRVHLTGHPLVHLKTAARLPGDVRRLQRVIRDVRPDLVKVHGTHNPQAAIAAVRERVPIVWVISSTMVPKPLRKPSLTYVRRWADSLLATGRSMLTAYGDDGRLASKAFIYFPPVDTDRYRPLKPQERVEARRDLGIGPDETAVVCLANMVPQKDIDLLVRTAAEVNRIRPVRFVHIGGSTTAHAVYAEQIREMVRTHSVLHDRFMFLGERTDAHRLLGAFDAKLLTSRDEGVATVAGEAMASGLPVVTTDVGGMREAVRDGIAGFVVRDRRPEALAERVLDATNPGAARPLSEGARTWALEAFSVSACVDVHMSAFAHALRHREDR